MARFVKGQIPHNKGVQKPLEDRLLSKIQKTTDCWYWIGKVTNNYGSFGYRDNSVSRTKTAHRAVYELLVGEIPKGYQIDHLCKNKLCVNPQHLEAVTPKENLRREPNQVTTINEQKTHCKYGHEFTSENTYIHKQRGSRLCKECMRVNTKRYIDRLKKVG